ncbi:hypothetical protein JZ751_002394 [Albula glossodonta]|uniref:Grh/CP2 DB domain-containing protein n=1 Tax=Albula glossodonta TaxID=121402 RepID=A0A8T2N974_9TELE|nr:hypothetical protein JZ751_002394 [Albula glossodonta]
MTQEHDNKRAVLVLQNEVPYAQRRQFTNEDEAWKSFLENPLTAATKAMMSINGDEDSAAALGLLYDYYKVPREKRSISQAKTDVLGNEVDPNKRSNFITHRNLMAPLQDATMAAPESRIPVLKNVPFNIVLPGNQLTPDKRAPFPSPDTTVTVSIATVPNYAIKAEGPAHGFAVASQGGGHCAETDTHAVAFDRQLNHSQFSPNPQPRTPDSTFTETFKDTSHELRMASIAPEDYAAFDSESGNNFEYTLEASKSLRQKSCDGTMTYLNKGQFYPISLRETENAKVLHHPISKVRSVVMVVFGEEKCRDDQLKHWKYWHSRQHTAKQRCIDIVNCLSTDFSSQKGVKGLPLNLQIDTYSYNNRSNKPIHRAYCQIKVFCDKGAERKIRDEERKQSRRKGKGPDGPAGLPPFADVKVPLLHKRSDITTFKMMSDFDTQPVLFIPDIHFSSFQRHPFSSEDGEEGSGMKRLPFSNEEEFGSPPNKMARMDEPKKEKYEVPIDKLGKVYKKCKKGILVNMDDNIIKHYSNEDTFQIHMEELGGMANQRPADICLQGQSETRSLFLFAGPTRDQQSSVSRANQRPGVFCLQSQSETRSLLLFAGPIRDQEPAPRVLIGLYSVLCFWNKEPNGLVGMCTQVSVFSRVQVSVVSQVQVSVVSQVQVSVVSQVQVSVISQVQVSVVSKVQMSVVSQVQVSVVSQVQVSVVSQIQVSVVSQVQVSVVSQVQVSVVSQVQVSVVSQVQVSMVSQIQMSVVSQAQVSVVSQVQVSVVSQVQVSVVSQVQVSVVSQVQVSMVSQIQVSGVSQVQVSVVSQIQVSVVSQVQSNPSVLHLITMVTMVTIAHPPCIPVEQPLMCCSCVFVSKATVNESAAKIALCQ